MNQALNDGAPSARVVGVMQPAQNMIAAEDHAEDRAVKRRRELQFAEQG